MSTVDVVDETFLAVPPTRVAAEFADPAGWRRFWPDLQLSLVIDRGPKGIRWTVAGALVGSMEVWLEPVLDGTVLHYYLRADPSDPNGRPAPLPPRRAGAEISRRQRTAKAIALGLKDALEEGRPPGVAPVPLPAESTAPVEPAPAASLSSAPAPASTAPAAGRPGEQGHPAPGSAPGAGTTVSP
jgi:hypothetical protein